ncbi:hypothetical protein BDV24DRAFT_150735 [Aspergillus arachidicola]|uniref:Cupredoxin n=1 Tax=Aspergillus arachidicola TaxID=656916 RepID=A0A5N6YEA9_9EURO|nr:hypothetical protein BDV24DRAFT_150735 [Aspergillus arachidicola]
MLIIPLLLIYALCGTAIFLQPNHNTKVDFSSGNSTSSSALPTGTPCAGNSPENRSQWCGYDIDTDWSEVVPDTGVTREYWLDIDEIAAAPDGYLRTVMAINGSIPGPTIYADWGDYVVVHVTNHLQEAKNGTSIHWHGMWQRGIKEHDGVTYCWRAMQYGSSWYHSHIGLQAWNGVFGGIIINGPATASYDEDAGVMILSDWTHETADEMYQFAQLCGPPELPNALINGTNVFGSGNHTRGSRLKLQVTKGKSYRLRLVNAALDANFIFIIDNHKLTTIAMDLVPIELFSTHPVTIGMGQRYDIIITADQASLADSFWIRAIPLQACSENADPSNNRGILHYEDTPSVPETLSFIYPDETCDHIQAASLVPHVPKSVPPPNLQEMYFNSTTMEILWEDPTLMQIYDGESAFPNSSAVISLPKADQWFYLDIETRQPIGHPIHLHGHDFFILAQGQGSWDGSSRTENPPRRDTAMLPSNGSSGFALPFLERTDEVVSTIDYELLQDTCESWMAYDELHNIVQEDSGV